MWDVLNSGQVHILTFELSSPWPHHLMPLKFFSSSFILHLYLPPPPSPPLSLALFCLFPSLPELHLYPFGLPSSLHICLSTLPSPLRCLSQVSDRPISAPMIAVGVLAWQLSQRWQEWAQPESKCRLCSCSRTRLTQRPIPSDRQRANASITVSFTAPLPVSSVSLTLYFSLWQPFTKNLSFR